MRKTALLLLTLLGLGAMLWAQQATGFKAKRTVTLTEPAKVGAQVLPEGEYKLTHLMEGSEHIMVFKLGKQEYRVKCDMQALNGKAEQTQFWYAPDSSGQRVLEAMVFQGDTVKHVLAQ